MLQSSLVCFLCAVLVTGPLAFFISIVFSIAMKISIANYQQLLNFGSLGIILKQPEIPSIYLSLKLWDKT